MPTLRVLALDPGERVGYATAEVKDGKLSAKSLKHGISPLKDFALRIARVYDTYDVVVMESWRLSAVHAKHLIGSSMPTCQLIGMVRLLAWQHPKVKLVSQAPAIKSTADKTMRKLRPDWYEIVSEPIAHDDGHHQDAIRHLFHWYWVEFVGKEGS